MTTLLRSECRAVGRHCDSERQPFLCSGPTAAAASGAGLLSSLVSVVSVSVKSVSLISLIYASSGSDSGSEPRPGP